MKCMRNGTVRMVLGPVEVEQLRQRWNEHVVKAVRRDRAFLQGGAIPELDSTVKEVWCIGAPRNQVHFCLKEDPKWLIYVFYMRRGWKQFKPSGLSNRQQIESQDVVRVEREVFLRRMPAWETSYWSHCDPWSRPSIRSVQSELAHRLETEPDFWKTGLIHSHMEQTHAGMEEQGGTMTE